MKYFKLIIVNALITIVILLVFVLFTQDKSVVIQKELDNSITKHDDTDFTIVTTKLKDQVQQEITNSRKTIITETVKNVSPAVVGITVKEVKQYAYQNPFGDDPFFRRFFGDRAFNKEVAGLGSGTIISSDGYILTNDHVAGSADQITVTLSNGKHYAAERVGTDITTDICLLKIEEENLPYIPFGNSDDILIGEWVIALGNPFGLFDISDKPTVTVGVVSATKMNLTPVENRYYLDMIQTDASINQGNSGGPLVNSIGELIGMNTLIFTAGGSGGNVGVGFAIPANKLQKIIKELKEQGVFERNFWTGLRIHSIDEGIAKYYNLNNTKGVIITEVIENSPANKAKLGAGDIILKVDDFNIDNYETLKGILQNYKTDETITLTVLRNSEQLNIKMKLERRP